MSAIAAETAAQIDALVRVKSGDPAARAHSLQELPGHAGFSYSFILERPGGGVPAGKLVIRIAPPGVKIAGPADIVRQAKVIASLAGSTVAVPPLYWCGDEPEFFGRPYMVVGFVESFKLGESDLPPEHLRRLAHKGVELMAALHELPWQPRRDAFGDPVPLSEELKRLDYLLDRPTLDAALAARAPKLGERLRATLPRAPRIGCVHGDFQWSNVLFDRQGPVALIDWELSLIGPTLLDLGWIGFFADPLSFVSAEIDRFAPLSPEEMAAIYCEARACPLSMDEVRWFRAFAGYRFGVITCFNLMLHRRGKREDPHWEDLALSAPRMFERALELLG